MERDEWLRAAWRVTVARETAAEQLVFVDEMGTNTSLHPLYAWSPRGERAHCSVPRNRSGCLRGLPRERSRPEPSARAGSGDGQPPLCPQGRTRQGAHRERGLRATLSATVLTGLQPHRRGLLEGQRPYA